MIQLAGGPVCWNSRKQKSVALSSTEAEYMAMSDTSQQLVWLKSLFGEIGYKVKPITLNVDNKGAIFLAKNRKQEHRSKHIDIRYHFMREKVEEKIINVVHDPTQEQLADIMTKIVTFDTFVKMRKQIGLHIYQ